MQRAQIWPRVRRFPVTPGLVLSVIGLSAAACQDVTPVGSGRPPGSNGSNPPIARLGCDLPQQFLFDGGVGRDGIPALMNPDLVAADDPAASYLRLYAAEQADVPELPELRVIGLLVDGLAVAIPHNILWWHEIANFEFGGRRMAVTYCPLTASALVFDATGVGAQRFGVSGLVFMNNLVMFDPETESLWPQMMMGARCGPLRGTGLVTFPHVEMGWEAWKALHPDTKVVSSDLGFGRDYARYPYDLYEAADEFLLFPMPEDADRRLRSKDRVLGVPHRNGGLAFSFDRLANEGEHVAVTATVGGTPMVVLWDRAAGAAQAYEPRSPVGPASISVEGERFVDRQSGSRWTVDGAAIEGSRTGERLVPVADAFVSFWFAWSAFYPETAVWAP